MMTSILQFSSITWAVWCCTWWAPSSWQISWPLPSLSVARTPAGVCEKSVNFPTCNSSLLVETSYVKKLGILILYCRRLLEKVSTSGECSPLWRAEGRWRSSPPWRWAHGCSPASSSPWDSACPADGGQRTLKHNNQTRRRTRLSIHHLKITCFKTLPTWYVPDPDKEEVGGGGVVGVLGHESQLSVWLNFPTNQEV